MRRSARNTPLPASLAAQEIPVVAPLLQAGESLHVHQGFRYAVFPAPRRTLAGTGQQRRAGMGRAVSRPHPCGGPRRAGFSERGAL